MSAPRRKAGANCCVVGCKNNTLNSPGTRFYVFSRVYYKKAQTDKWIAAVQRKNPDGSPWEPKKYTRICSRHFIGNKKSDHPFSPSFVPTIFPTNNQNDCKVKKTAGATTVARFQHSQATQSDFAGSSQDFIQASSELSWKIKLPRGCENVSRVPSQRHQPTQVDFVGTTFDCKIFICNRYVNGSICEAETQACIPLIGNEIDNTIKIKIEPSVEADCADYEANFADQDMDVGPASIDFHENYPLCSFPSFAGFSSITTDEEMVSLAGVSLHNFNLLLKVLQDSTILNISQEDRLLIFLSKMKLGLTFSALGILFNMNRKTISRAFYRTLKFLSKTCRNFVVWPDKEVVRSTIPTSLEETSENYRVAIIFTDIKVERPKALKHRVQLYSAKKETFTVKVLVGCTPNGEISFVSKCYDGATSDAQIAKRSGFLNLLEPGDVVLAAEELAEIRSAVAKSGIRILPAMPQSRHANDVSLEEPEKINVATIIRDQAARTVRSIKSYAVLSKLSENMLPYADDIFFMCCALANLQSHSISLL